MENQLNFVFMLPLKEMSLRRLVINLWNEREILSSIEKFCSGNLSVNYEYSETWRQAVECKVIASLSKLRIPKLLAKQALHIVTPIGLEIKRWKEFHERYLREDWGEFQNKNSPISRRELNASVLSKLCWTTCGTVDYIKTAEKLIRCEMLGILTCYRLSCLYCLENCIPLLWEKLPEEMKKTFYNENCTSQMKRVKLQFCWPYILKGEHYKLDSMFEREYGINKSFNLFAFEISAKRGNKAATEYFFHKLTCEEKETTLNRTVRFLALVLSSDRYYYPQTDSFDTFPLENISDALVYLISQINHDEWMQIFQYRPAEVLICFLNWRWHDLFVKIADLTWTFLPAGHYGYLLENLSDYFRKQKYYFPFLNLFQELLTSSPINFRKEFVDHECQFGDFLPLLFGIQDSDTIKVIFRNVNTADRLRLVNRRRIFELFSDFILNEKCDMVKLCLREATLSNEDRERLTDAFLTFWTAGKRKIKTCISIRNRFLKFMDEIYGNAQSNRSPEDYL